jgi:hypothetical protein
VCGELKDVIWDQPVIGHGGLGTVPDRTLGGVYLLRVKIMQRCEMVILLKSLIALGVVFIGL